MLHVGCVRADATRNRGQIITAARELVAVAGAAVTMEQLAERAGVAVGTLYRHFPTKTALLAAVVAESVESIAALAAAALARSEVSGAPSVELESLFRSVTDAFAADRAVKQAALRLGVSEPDPFAVGDVDSPAARAGRTVGTLLEAAQAGGGTRADLTVADLFMLVSQLPDGTSEQRHRYTEIVLAGLRT